MDEIFANCYAFDRAATICHPGSISATGCFSESRAITPI